MVKLINYLFIISYYKKDRFIKLALIIKNNLNDQNNILRKKPLKFFELNPVKQRTKGYIIIEIKIM